MQVVTAVVAAIIGAIAYIVLQEAWQAYKNRGGVNERSTLVGEWAGTWWLDDDPSHPYVTADNIRVTTANDRGIRGEGRDDKGIYVVRGRLSEQGVASMFYGYVKSPLNGVLILQPSAQGTEYTGRWSGYLKEGRIAGGAVVWKRVPGA